MTNPLPAKDPDTDTLYAIDVRKIVTDFLRRDWPYAEDDIVKPHFGVGFYLQCTTAGETPRRLPERYPRADGQTMTDGSVVWTVKHPSNSSLPSISSAEWTISDDALTVDSQTFTGGILRPVFAGGVAGETYDLTARITWSNSRIEDVSFTLPVEEQ